MDSDCRASLVVEQRDELTGPVTPAPETDRKADLRITRMSGTAWLLAYRLSERSFDESVIENVPFSSVRRGLEERDEYPEPRSVLFRSMMIPGWGQITNRQIWKVPIIYGLFAGLGYWNYELTREYHGFRAAYYNATSEEQDERFGPTPDFVPPDMSSQQMRQIRDQLRNRRDMTYVYLFLAYGLNILDAYVFAHMRSFDVSDDLSARASIAPDIDMRGAAGIRLRLSLDRR